MEKLMFKEKFTRYLKTQTPFLFIIDFECNSPLIFTLDEAKEKGVLFDVKGLRNVVYRPVSKTIDMALNPINQTEYFKRFNNVMKHLINGDTYLINLTFPTEIKGNFGLKDVFNCSKAPYKLLFKDEFVVFSPECFICTQNQEIFTYPMKGTIDANLKNAEEQLLKNKKEEWEHNTIVDLMRNDLSMIADEVVLNKYRFVERINTNAQDLLQTSSEIKGVLKPNYQETLCDDILRLLPAGSISGAPKTKTVEIIKENEIEERGYYTGIFGIFDGKEIDSAVNIRFIQKQKQKFVFRSGGGITCNSKADEEYEEMLKKVYIPIEK
ncbi:MAG: aminodeoxychorismate synthase component I [Brumimicrobium sp.]